MSAAEETAWPEILREEACTVATVRKVAAMLDGDPDRWADGDVLPRGWQFVLSGADTRHSELRSDGYPGLGLPVPDIGLPRLMIVGRSVRYHDDIRVGAVLRRRSRIASLERRDRQGSLSARLTIEHEFRSRQDEALLLSESQTFILLPAERAPDRPERGPVEPHRAARSKVVTPDDILLFQYSALGFNSHRIHWDREFARETEGFPDLVVNGGLTTLLLTEFLRSELNETPRGFTARYVAPLFSGRPITLAADPREGGWTLRAFDDSGYLAAQIEAET